MKKLLFSFLALCLLALPASAQFADQRQYVGSTGGTTNARTVAIPNYALNPGVVVRFVASATNTGAMTLSVNGTAAKNVLKPSLTGLVALTGNELVAGQVAEVLYDGTQYELINSTSLVNLQGLGTGVATALATPPNAPGGVMTVPTACVSSGGGQIQYFSPTVGPVTICIASGTDAAPAFRSAIVSNQHVVAQGNFTLASTQTSSYPVTGAIGVHVVGQTNFVLDLSGATISASNAITSGLSGPSYFQFDGDTNYAVYGGTFVGNQTGKTSGGTIAIQSFNDVNFLYKGQNFTGDWYSNYGVPFDGDYLVNGLFEGANMPNVTSCFDFGFIQNVTFKDFVATGKYASGEGVSCVDVVYDVPLVGTNTTGFTITDSTNVNVANGHASNFATGWYVASGAYYTFANNYWFSNLGTAGTAGVGGGIFYNPSGTASSVGHPPNYVNIIGDHYIGNGNATAGGQGIAIASGAIANGDVIQGVYINAAFENNVSQAIEATSTSHLADVTVVAHCSGASQTTCAGGNISAVASPSCSVSFGSPVTLTSGATKTLCSVTLTAGVWTLNGVYGAVAGTGTTIFQMQGAVSTTNNALPGNYSAGFVVTYPNTGQNYVNSLGSGPVQVNIATTTTYYLVENIATSAGTLLSGFGTLTATRN